MISKISKGSNLASCLYLLHRLSDSNLFVILCYLMTQLKDNALVAQWKFYYTVLNLKIKQSFDIAYVP